MMIIIMPIVKVMIMIKISKNNVMIREMPYGNLLQSTGCQILMMMIVSWQIYSDDARIEMSSKRETVSTPSKYENLFPSSYERCMVMQHQRL